MEHTIDVAPGIALWVQERGDPAAPPLLLIMGANASSKGWPDQLVDRLAQRHRVIVYDHRDTGRSTSLYDDQPYAIRDLAEDAVGVLDGLGIDRAHVAGMSMGGTLVQLLLVDHPDRLRTATLFCTSAIGTGITVPDGSSPVGLPDPDPRLLAIWATMGDERDDDAEMRWRMDHWRILNGDAVPFDEAWFRTQEQRAIDHAGTMRSPVAHASADQSGLDRTADLARVAVPTLVIDAPNDPINPPPHASVTAGAIGGARLAVIPGMGHALSPSVLEPLATLILEQTAEVDGGGR